MERDITRIALFAALIAALGLIPKLDLALGAPITAQSMGVMLCGAVLGARRGGLAALLFIALVALGLPLLAGGRGGLGLFASPSGGFLIGWPPAAFLTGLIVEKWRGAPVALVAGAASVIGGVGLMYVFGIAGMALALDKTLLEAGAIALIYIPGDLIKAILAGALTGAIHRARPAAVPSRA